MHSKCKVFSGDGHYMNIVLASSSLISPVSLVQVDFSSLPSTTLKRYKKKFNLVTADNASKADVINAIERHFQTLPINEGKDIIDFLKFMQKQRAPPPSRQDTNTPEPQ